MRRSQVEGLLKNAAAQSGTSTFEITVPYAEVSAALTILNHLQAAGQFGSFSRRDGENACTQCPEMSCGCIRIYDYTG